MCCTAAACIANMEFIIGVACTYTVNCCWSALKAVRVFRHRGCDECLDNNYIVTLGEIIIVVSRYYSDNIN